MQCAQGSASLLEAPTLERILKLWPIGRPLVGSFPKGLWEVRSAFEGIEYRVLFGIVDDTMYILHGFVKKSQTTLKADKNLAYDRLKQVKKASRR